MFDLKKILNGRMNVPEPEVYPAGTAITPGMALTLTDGKLMLCGATSVPTHISMGIAEIGKKVAAAPVDSAQLYEVPVTASPSDLKEGQKVTIATGGLGVTATTASGVATIVALNGAAKIDDKIVVRF